MDFHVKFGCFASKTVGEIQENPQNWRALGPAPYGGNVDDPQEIRPSIACYPAKFDLSRSNGTIVIKQIRLKKN